MERKRFDSQKIRYLSTAGDGNCFFHAVFGDGSSGVYKADRAQEMRQEWCKFLSQFESLNDTKMPQALKDRLSLVFHNVFPGRESYFCTRDLYIEYLSKINKKDYYIHVEEVPILAYLANIKIDIYSPSCAYIQEIQPDQYMINTDYRRNQELWGDKKQETIYLEGGHYSRAIIQPREQTSNFFDSFFSMIMEPVSLVVLFFGGLISWLFWSSTEKTAGHIEQSCNPLIGLNDSDYDDQNDLHLFQ